MGGLCPMIPWNEGSSGPAMRARPIAAGDWYPYDAYSALLQAIDREVGREDLSLMPTLGRFAARQDLSGVFKVISVLASIPRILQASSIFWSRYCDGGSFEITLLVKPRIDAKTDCTKVTCAIVARPDDAQPDDRSQELAVPVSFKKTSSGARSVAGSASEPNASASTADEDGGGSSTLWLVLGATALVGVAGAAGFGAWRYVQGRA